MADLQPPVKVLIFEILSEFPSFRLLVKGESRLMKVIDVLLKVLTLGRTKTFLIDFVTTVGYTVYVPKSWLDDPAPFNLLVTLRHERVHMRQRRKYGMFLFSFLYLLFPLPAGLAYFRMAFEREAFTESLMAAAELGHVPDIVHGAGLRDVVISAFTGSVYMWMWPFKKSVTAWYDRTADAAVARAKSLKSP
jgi:hypothetical protein